MDTTLLVETPEHIALDYQLAGPARRAAAYGIDLLVRGMVLLVVSFGVMLSSLAAELRLRGAEFGLMLLLFFLLEWGYFVVFELIWSGASPGKRAMRLRAINQDGRNLSARESILRNLLRAADLLPIGYVLGALTMCLDDKFRRLGDMAAGTIVVAEPRTILTRLSSPNRPREVAGLPARVVLTRPEREALAQFAQRIGRLSPARARELAEMVSPYFEARFGLGRVPAVDLLLTIHERASRG